MKGKNITKIFLKKLPCCNDDCCSGQIERVEVDGRVSMRSDVRGSPLVRLSMAKHVSLQSEAERSGAGREKVTQHSIDIDVWVCVQMCGWVRGYHGSCGTARRCFRCTPAAAMSLCYATVLRWIAQVHTCCLLYYQLFYMSIFLFFKIYIYFRSDDEWGNAVAIGRTSVHQSYW